MALVLGLALIFSGIGVLAQDSRPDSHAIDPAAFAPGKQLDFWIGTWDLTWKGGRGTNVVNKVLDDRVIQENFTGSTAKRKGFQGDEPLGLYL